MGETISSQSLRKKNASAFVTSAFVARSLKVWSSVDRSRTPPCVICNEI